MHETNLDNILLIVERERINYKALLGGKGATGSPEPKHLEYLLPGNQLLTVDLHYTEMDSPIGFPFNRLTCIMRLDGKRITKAQLSEICTLGKE